MAELPLMVTDRDFKSLVNSDGYTYAVSPHSDSEQLAALRREVLELKEMVRELKTAIRARP